MWDWLAADLADLHKPAQVSLVLICFVILYFKLHKIEKQLSNIEKQMRTDRTGQ